MELYLDNFRGFEKQYIELNDVNFLVGENSTGKTTLLGLLSLITGGVEDIWNMDFKNDYVDFGSFSDIVNKSGKTRSEFTIGIKKRQDSFTDIESEYAETVISYSETDGFPTATLISMRNNNLIFTIRILKNSVNLTFKKVEVELDKWVGLHIGNENVIINDKFNYGLNGISIAEVKRNPMIVFDFMKIGDYYGKEIDSSFPALRDTLGLFSDLNKNSQQTIWIDPVRSKPKRIYEPQKLKYSAEGEHTPTLLRDILLNNTAKQNKAFIAELERFGSASGLFDEVKIDQYRKSKDSPFSLLFKLHNKELKISNVGYGISQVLPILTEVLYAPKGSTFLIQQPEVHLHPRSQAYFGEFVYNQLVTQKKKFVIETHSDYLIDRFRLQLRKHNGNVHKKVNILFFETDGQKNKITKIAIEKNGDYGPDQPQKFREFFLKEEMELLGL